jgi:adenylate cyclase class 2
MTQYLEVEAKLQVEALDAVVSRLEAAGAVLRHPRVLERNFRYEDAEATLTPAGKLLRLRQDSRVRLTYKGPPLGAQAEGQQSRFEAEVTVNDFATTALILESLGYRVMMIYEKYRTTYELSGTEVVLDEMPFGSFVEIEGEPDGIEQVIATLELGACARFQESYGQLFEHVRANLNLQFRDLTFANFAGIEVPPAAFRPPAG